MIHTHLPLLTLEQTARVFEVAGLSTNDVADLAGVSRVTLHYWKIGRSTPHSNSHGRVSTLAHYCLHAIKNKRLPVKDLPRKRYLRVMALSKLLYDPSAIEALATPKITITA